MTNRIDKVGSCSFEPSTAIATTHANKKEVKEKKWVSGIGTVFESKKEIIKNLLCLNTQRGSKKKNSIQDEDW